MATTASSSAPTGAKPHDSKPAPEAPPGATSTGPDRPPGSPLDEHTRPTIIPGEGPPPRLDFADLAAISAWLDDLNARVDDLASVAEDQIASPAERMFGRAGAREQIDHAYGSLADLIALARAGLGGAP